ncbi:hypothetical protein KJ951_03595 [Patescibacteria group bacterium]|nr:hypothetical protein [Patescibacteria group bacterium]MBU1703461.1 hypothetical protein [Patescibacteria group bacterium]MBU1953457.1 hypothetical protein [Patescibacteria group bacterium]
MSRKDSSFEDFVQVENQKIDYLDVLDFFRDDYADAAILLAANMTEDWCVELGNGIVVTMALFLESVELYFDGIGRNLNRDDMARLLGVEGYAPHCVSDERELERVRSELREIIGERLDTFGKEEK